MMSYRGSLKGSDGSRCPDPGTDLTYPVSLGFGMSGKMSGDRVRRQVPQRDNVTALRSFVSIIYHNGEAYNQLTCSAPSTPCPLLLDIVWYYYFCLLNHPPQAASAISFSQCSNPSTAPTVLPKPFTKFLGKASSISVYIMDDCWLILRNYACDMPPMIIHHFVAFQSA